MDVDTVEPGADFASVITQAVGSCEVLIALIGPTWSTIADQRGRRRLDDPDDFVVLEIQAALEREIHVIPVLVDGAVMPNRYDLPEELRDIARRNAVRLDHETFRSDVAILLDAVERILPTFRRKSDKPTAAHASRPPVPQRLVTTIKTNRKWIVRTVTAVAFSPEEHLLASASFDKTVRLWNPATGQPVGHPPTGHTGEVRAVAFSPDGHLLASASEDGTVRLWGSEP